MTGRRDLLVDLVWSAALASAIVAPLWLGRGFWLVGDMVFVPEQPWKAAWLGLDDALPRAVPMDALVSVASQVLPGDWLQRILLTGGLIAAGVGIGRVVGGCPWFARAAAIGILVWNPWVHERLLIGQWAILLGYLVLPWVVLGARSLREGSRHGWAPAALAVGLAAICSPSSGVMAVGVLALFAGRRDRGTWWRVTAISVVANLTWLVPAVTATSASVATDGVFTGFAARAESSLGVLPSVLSLGGIWKTSVVAPERTEPVIVALSCLLTLAAAAGWWRLGSEERTRWAVLACATIALAAAPSVAAVAAAYATIGEVLPGLALLRDSHRFLAPLGLVLAVGLAHAVTSVHGALRPGREALWAVVGLAVVAPVLLLPSLALGGAGELRRSHYPEEWLVAADRLRAEPGRTVVLPWAGSYRAFGWNHDAAVLDPAPRFFPGEVVVDDRTFLDDRVVPAEDPFVRQVGGALAADDPTTGLAALGVRWVLVERGNPGTVAGTPPGLVRYRGADLVLREIPDPAPYDRTSPPWRVAVVLAGHAGSTVLLLAGGIVILLPGRCKRRHT